MGLTISIPDDFADVLGDSAEERAQRAREAIALELYREGKISLRRMGELAGVGGDYWAADQLRAKHRLPINYSQDELDADRLATGKLNEE
jgi:predicted HTH domain antitoxin